MTMKHSLIFSCNGHFILSGVCRPEDYQPSDQEDDVIPLLSLHDILLSTRTK